MEAKVPPRSDCWTLEVTRPLCSTENVSSGNRHGKATASGREGHGAGLASGSAGRRSRRCARDTCQLPWVPRAQSLVLTKAESDVHTTPGVNPNSSTASNTPQ